ncbi:MAG: hypothetical protein A6F72_03640 [Cycloclasticus sp. symbiont of Poecilosclerida sp. N]|nr:MAG: hypothetical protein A6F72_01655 [Cycloclasticus sp. symbiont of Poecilosclerida sp. N]ORU91833.1 MAG: hypothetical protein A6F72_03640 [Cycloclasticus sp. symbiont of Poecilosclerida sp. N]
MEREQRVAENIKKSIIVGEVISLEADGDGFICLVNNEEPEHLRGTIPIFDVYGTQDLDSVKKRPSTRKLTIKKNNPLLRQIEILGADHLFTGLESTLVRSIHNRLMSAFEQAKPNHKEYV